MSWITPYHQDTDFSTPLTIEDKILIFREQTVGWLLDIADTCINGRLECMRHSGFAVLTIVFSYFEMIAKLQDGYESEHKSECYFRQGVLDVFPSLKTLPDSVVENVLTILYRSVRCGLYHCGMAQGRIAISGDYQQPLQYDQSRRYVGINPHKLVPHIKEHFRKYMSQVSDPVNTDVRERFERRFTYLQTWDPLVKRK